MGHKIKFLCLLTLAFILISVCNRKISILPPLGKFLSPYTGYLVLVNSDKLPNNKAFTNLTDSVNIVWDDRRIPHIFSANEHDLFFTQGYIHAFERLWQMEFQVQAVAGRLSEIIGSDGLAFDKFQRRIGMIRGADGILKLYESDTEMMEFLNDYTDGINSYIKSLSSKNYPLEYKILDYSPELWTPKKCILLYMYMAWELSDVINRELKTLVEKGATFIQIDEPSFAIIPGQMDDWIDLYNATVKGVNAKLALHVCFGNLGSRPRGKRQYEWMFPKLLAANAEQLVLEYANREMIEADLWSKFDIPNELGAGVIDIKSFHVETPEDVAERIRILLQHTEPEKMYINPDCGFFQLPRWLAYKKLQALVAGTKIVRSEL